MAFISPVERVKQNLALFKEKKVIVEPIVVPGGHTWMNGKRFLAPTLQQVFKDSL
jgi:hypothetical protein